MRESNTDGSGVFIEVGAALGARNWNDVVSLRHDPGKGELRSATVFFVGNFLDSVDQLGVLLDVLAPKPRRGMPVITGIQLLSVA